MEKAHSIKNWYRMFALRTYFDMVYGFGEYNYWEEIGMALNLLKFRPPPPPPKTRKIAQLQKIISFTCNPIKNQDTRHELLKNIYNPKQDRKIWVIKICCFPGIIIIQHFCKMTSFA